MMTQPEIEQFLANLTQQRDQAATQVNAIDGAIAALGRVLAPPPAEPVKKGPQLVPPLPAAEGERV